MSIHSLKILIAGLLNISSAEGKFSITQFTALYILSGFR